MARLIDADKRIAEIKKIYCDGCDNYDGVRCRVCWVDDAICLIDDATTVDAVEVVRCKDCKWVYRDPYSGCYYCHERQVQSTHFCSYAERKAGDGNG